MRSSLKILILFFVGQVEMAQCSAGLGLRVEDVHELIKQTAPKYLNSIYGLKLNEEIPPNVLRDVQAYGDGVTNVVNAVIFDGEGGMKPAIDIMSHLKGNSASPTSVLNLQTYVQSAAFVGHTAYQMYNFRKIANDLDRISQELRKINITTGRELFIIVRDIHVKLASIETMLSLMTISYMNDFYVLEKNLKQSSDLVKIGKSKIESIIPNMFRQASKSTCKEENYLLGATVVAALGIGAAYVMSGLWAFAILPMTAFAVLDAGDSKYDVLKKIPSFTELRRLSKCVLEREEKLAKMEDNIKKLNLRIRLEESKIQEKMQEKERARREKIEEVNRKDITDARRKEHVIIILLALVLAGFVCFAIVRFTANTKKSKP